MGQKVNPIGFRTGFIEKWKSCWFANSDNYGNLVSEDFKIRCYISKFFGRNNVHYVEIERNFGVIIIYLRCLNSGVIIGEKGEKINTITKNLEKMLNCVVQINVVREKKEFLTAKMVALDIESQVNQRIPYKKAIKHAIDNATRLHIPGIKIFISGRLGGAEIARKERFSSGKVPAHTLRADIDYNCGTIETIYGTLGLKVWLYKGEIYKKPAVLLSLKDNKNVAGEDNKGKLNGNFASKRNFRKNK
jgi:small subunit ribosomal protein S3